MDNLASTIESLCKSCNFVIGNYYIMSGDQVTCKSQPFFINGTGDGLTAFQDKSQGFPFGKGKGLPGRVWASNGHEWCPNVQNLPSDKYARKQLAIDNGIKACLGVAHTEGGTFKGVMEFFLTTEAKENSDIVAKVKAAIQK